MIGVGWVNNTGTLGLTFSNTASTVTDANVATTFIGVHGSATATTSTTATLATGSGGTIGAMSWIAIPGGGGGATFVGSDLTRTAAAVITAPSSVQLTGNAPSGGTPPYSYQWQRSLTAVGGYASLSGKTSLSLTDTSVTNGTLYFYQLVESDSASNTYTTPFIATYAPTNATINICWIGDSITEGLHTTVQTTPQAEEHALLWDFPFTNVTGTNEGVSGLATNDWVSGGSYLPAAITACKAAGANYVQIMLGTNDASTNYNDSTATFISNYDNITAYINAQMPGVPIIINAPSYADYLRYGTPYTNAWYAKITGYVAALGTITGSNVHIGDKTAFTYFSGANDYNYLYDGVHPNDNGATILGGLWAQAFFNVTGLGPPRATPRVGSSQINGG
jgi:lysophospholipase L1-like esterase